MATQKKSKKELALQAFETYKDADKVFVTDDNNVFLRKNSADLHARSSRGDKVQKVHSFYRPDEMKEKKEKESNQEKKTAQERIDAINELQTVAEVKAAVKGESAKTVKADAEARIKAIEEAEKKKLEGSKKGNNGSESPEKRDKKNSK